MCYSLRMLHNRCSAVSMVGRSLQIGKRLAATGTSVTPTSSQEDRVWRLIPYNKPMPLPSLAMMLPDEVLQDLPNGLLKHVLLFPERYRVIQRSGGGYDVCCIKRWPGDAKRRGYRGDSTSLPENVTWMMWDRLPPPLCAVRMRTFVPLESLWMLFLYYRDPHLAEAIVRRTSAPSVDLLSDYIKAFEQQILVPSSDAIKLWMLQEHFAPQRAFAGAEDKPAASPPQETLREDASSGSPLDGDVGMLLTSFEWKRVSNMESVAGTIRNALGRGCVLHEDHAESAQRQTCFVQIALPAPLDTSVATLHGAPMLDLAYMHERMEQASSSRSTLAPATALPSLDEVTAFSTCLTWGVHEYNVARVSRYMSCKDFVTLASLSISAQGVSTQPLAMVLAVWSEQQRQGIVPYASYQSKDDTATMPELSTMFEFNDATQVVSSTLPSTGDVSTSVTAVRFLISNTMCYPKEYSDTPTSELRAAYEELRSTYTSSKLAKLKARQRAMILQKRRVIHRCLSLREMGVSPVCHPDVLAYYLYDSLPGDGSRTSLVMKGLADTYLPEDVRRITDTRNLRWLKSYPHLFRLVERPPDLYIIRTDIHQGLRHAHEASDDHLPASPAAKGIDGDSAPCVAVDGSEAAQLYDHHHTLIDGEEIQQFMMALVAERRLKAGAGRPVLVAQIHKFVPSQLRARIKTMGISPDAAAPLFEKHRKEYLRHRQEEGATGGASQPEELDRTTPVVSSDGAIPTVSAVPTQTGGKTVVDFPYDYKSPWVRYFLRYPDTFVLEWGKHPTELAVRLVPSFDPHDVHH